MSDFDSDSDYEETEYFVIGDFENLIQAQDLEDPNAAVKIIGADTKNPLVEINGKIFQGSHDLAEGTNLIFGEEEENARLGNPPFDEYPSTMYKFLGGTKKVLKFERIFVESKIDQNKNDKEESTKDKDEMDLKLDITYNEAIKRFSLEKNK